MACERYEALVRFHDGDLPPAEVADFRKHLSICPECRTELHHLQQSEGKVRDVVRRAIPGGNLADKVLRRIQQENVRISPEAGIEAGTLGIGIPTWLGWLAPVLAVLLIVVALRIPTKDPISQARPVLMTAQSSGEGESIGDERLPANQARALKPDQPLKIRERMLVSWLEGKQQVEILGQAQIRCSPQRLTWDAGDAELRFTLSEPLPVFIGNCELTITGTRIHLKGMATDTVTVTLLEGHVRYRTASGMGELLPGSPMHFGKNNCPVPISPNPLPVVVPGAPPFNAKTGTELSSPADRLNPFEGNAVNTPIGESQK